MEKPLNEHESLAIISSMIAGTRRKMSEGSSYFLVWGWATFLAALTEFGLLRGGFEHHYIVWAVFMPAAGILTGVLSRRDAQLGVKTHLDRAMNALWLGFVVTLLLILGTAVKIGWENVYPIVILMYGLGTFVSGGLLRFRPLMFGGALSWALGMAALFVGFDIQLLLVAASVAVSYLIPGYLLKTSKQ
jgi:hypothetical protein